MDRRIAVCHWSLRPQGPADLIGQVRACGLDALQLGLAPLGEDDAWADAPAMIADAGISVISGMLAATGEDYTTLETIAETGGVRSDATWPATWERAQRCADAAAAMGLSLVTFHAGFLPPDRDDPLHDVMLDRLRSVATLFSDRDMTLALETGQETAATLLGVLEALAMPNLAVNFDPANMILYDKGDPIEAITALLAHVVQVHIKDATATAAAGTWGSEVVVGSGDVDWPTFLSIVPEDADLVLEREGGDERVADIRRAHQVVLDAT